MSTSIVQAQEIMGRSFIGMEEVQKHLGVQYDEDRLRLLARIPFSLHTLRDVKESHVLFPGAPLSLLDLRDRAAHLFHDLPWYASQDFARRRVECRWYLLRKESVPQAHYKSYPEQLTLLRPGEEVPFAVEMVFLVVLWSVARGEQLFKRAYVRCRDLNGTYRAGVGECAPDPEVPPGFDVYSFWDGFRDVTGLASSTRCNQLTA